MGEAKRRAVRGTVFNDDGTSEPFNPRLENPMIQDLCRQACEKVFKAIDDVMNIVPDDDIELSILIKNSILASVATNTAGTFVDFVYATANRGKSITDLTPEAYTDKLTAHLAKLAKVLIEGFAKRKAADSQ